MGTFSDRGYARVNHLISAFWINKCSVFTLRELLNRSACDQTSTYATT